METALPTEADLEDTGIDTFRALLARLSHQSVVRHFDAYADVAWDSAEFKIEPTDPRWELRSDDSLGATAWYQTLPQENRARLGLELIVSMMKTGLQFESVLKRGLLEFAAELPNRSPEFRYTYHEVIEEAQHSLMFQEFINRSGLDPRGLSRLNKLGSRFIIGLGRKFPPLFFFFVLGGEDPIDHVQRQELRSGAQLHPLIERIMRIHVTEEARHLSFARHYLKTQMRSMSRRQRLQLGIGAPLILSAMVQMMLKPSADLVRRYQIPKEVLTEAYSQNQQFRDEALASLRKVRRLCSELGILGPAYSRLWRALGLWEDQPVQRV
ncbi:MAG: AurF N-oxygenase family protein [Acidimicrobiales bacterium]